MNLNEAFMDITNQTATLESGAPIDVSRNQNANISLYEMDPLTNIEPIPETGDEMFGNMPDPLPGPASRRRKGGFRKSRRRTRKYQKLQKSRQPKKLKRMPTRRSLV